MWVCIQCVASTRNPNCKSFAIIRNKKKENKINFLLLFQKHNIFESRNVAARSISINLANSKTKAALKQPTFPKNGVNNRYIYDPNLCDTWIEFWFSSIFFVFSEIITFCCVCSEWYSIRCANVYQIMLNLAW